MPAPKRTKRAIDCLDVHLHGGGCVSINVSAARERGLLAASSHTAESVIGEVQELIRKTHEPTPWPTLEGGNAVFTYSGSAVLIVQPAAFVYRQLDR